MDIISLISEKLLHTRPPGDPLKHYTGYELILLQPHHHGNPNKHQSYQGTMVFPLSKIQFSITDIKTTVWKIPSNSVFHLGVKTTTNLLCFVGTFRAYIVYLFLLQQSKYARIYCTVFKCYFFRLWQIFRWNFIRIRVNFDQEMYESGTIIIQQLAHRILLINLLLSKTERSTCHR